MEIERSNIIAATRFVIQEILDHVSLYHLSVVEYEEESQDSSAHAKIVARLLCIIENGICHGIPFSHPNIPNSVPPVNPWPIICCLYKEREILNGSASVCDEVKSGLGKTRLWIRNALMSKQLGQLIGKIIEIKDVKNIPTSCNDATSSTRVSASDIYAKDSLLVSNDGVTFAGLLCNLNVLDFCFILKDNFSSLDGPLIPIDYSSCIKSNTHQDLHEMLPCQSGLEERLSSAIEQNRYLEEALSIKQSRLGILNEELTRLTAENASLQKSKADLETKLSRQQEENDRLSNLLVRQSKEVQNDLETVRETFKHSNSSLDAQNAELEKQLVEERNLRLAAEEALNQEKDAKRTMEAELAQLKALNSDREACLAEYKSQIAEMLILNKEFSEKLRNVSTDLKVSNDRASDLQEKVESMSTILASMNERYNQLKEEKAAKERSLQEAIDKANKADRLCAQLKGDLDANQEFTQNLQSQLDEAFTDLSSIQALQENLDRKSQTLRERDAMISELQRQCNEAERGLVEMARAVEDSRLAADRAEERVRLLSSARWTSDNEVTSCAQCAAPFSFSRRKHHCRNCGLIFCNECSDFKMPLPCSPKPKRVCETCHNQLMERYTPR